MVAVRPDTTVFYFAIMGMKKGRKMVSVEQRAYERYMCQSPIVYGYKNTDEFSEAVLSNHSMGGMCIEADYAIPKGVEIIIKMANYSPDAMPPEWREGYLAQVRWCQPGNGGKPGTFRIGVNYFEPVLF